MTLQKKIRIGSRGSNLALWQARWVADRLRELGADSEIVVIRTTGDANLERFSVIDTRGMFVKEIEEALLSGEIDLAVHSLKDLPTQQPEGLVIAATPEREDPSDVLIAAGQADSIAALPRGARVGTSSPRRIVQLRALRPDLEIVEIRGNVETRIRKVENGEVDAALLAYAGVHRLGLDSKISAKLTMDEMLPAPGQGALAIESRQGDELTEIISGLNHPGTRLLTSAERLLLEKLGGGCRLPLGACGTTEKTGLRLRAVLGRSDRPEICRSERRAASAEAAAERVLFDLRDQGAM